MVRAGGRGAWRFHVAFTLVMPPGSRRPSTISIV